MRNPDLPKLIRDIRVTNSFSRENIEQAAIELEKLEKIYKLYETGHLIGVDEVYEILHESPSLATFNSLI